MTVPPSTVVPLLTLPLTHSISFSSPDSPFWTSSSVILRVYTTVPNFDQISPILTFALYIHDHHHSSLSPSLSLFNLSHPSISVSLYRSHCCSAPAFFFLNFIPSSPPIWQFPRFIWHQLTFWHLLRFFYKIFILFFLFLQFFIIFLFILFFCI